MKDLLILFLPLIALVAFVQGCSQHSDCTQPHEFCTTSSTCDICNNCDVGNSVGSICPNWCEYVPIDVGDTTPDLTETDVVGNVRSFILPQCDRYTRMDDNSNSNIVFETATDTSFPTKGTVRLHQALNNLADLVVENFPSGVLLKVVQAYLVPSDLTVIPSTFYEGRSARMTLTGTPSQADIEFLGALAVEAGFAWVHVEDSANVRGSVGQDTCRAPVDLIFLLDGSGSIDIARFGGEPGTFQNKMLGFVKDVVGYFPIGGNETRVGVATFSNSVQINFHLNTFDDKAAMISAIDSIPYPASGTRTSLGIKTVRQSMFLESMGMRPQSAGVSRVLVVITDGKASSGYAPATEAQLLRDQNVNIFAIGVTAGVVVSELESMASTPHANFLYLLASFNNIADIVDEMSSTACEAPAIVDSGASTISNVEGCEAKYFRPQCGVLSNMVLEVRTITGEVQVFVSLTETHPGPAVYDFKDISEKSIKKVSISGSTGEIYVSVLGIGTYNEFELVVWSDMYAGVTDHQVSFNETDLNVNDLVFKAPTPQNLGDYTPNLQFQFISGNLDNTFSIDSNTGDISLAKPLDYEKYTSFELRVSGKDSQLECLTGFFALYVEVGNVNDNEPQWLNLPPFSASVPENAGIGYSVVTISAQDADGSPLTYSLAPAINRRRDVLPFQINSTTGEVTVTQALDAQDTNSYSMIIGVTDGTFSDSGTLDVAIDSVVCPPGEFSDDGTFPCQTATSCQLVPNQYEAVPSTPTSDAVCSNCSTCGDGTYLNAVCGPTSDTDCQPCSTCINSVSYETVQCTPTSNRQCAFCGGCNSNQIQTAACTLTSNTQCLDVDNSPCDPLNEYQVAGPTLTTARVCADLTLCGPNQYETLAPTLTSDRQCSNCSECATGFYADVACSAFDDSQCTECDTCDAGVTYESTPCTTATNRVCSPCSSCNANQIQIAECTLTSDTQCLDVDNSPCDAFTEYQVAPPTLTTARICANVTLCANDQYETIPPTPTTDRQCVDCGSCDPGLYTSVTCTPFTDSQCTDCDTCDVGVTYESTPCTSATNRVCSPCSSCNANQIQIAECTLTSDTQCLNVDNSPCDAFTEYQVAPPTLTTARICANVTLCANDQYEVISPTLTSDRQCIDCDSCDSDEFLETSCTPSSDAQCKKCDYCTPGVTYSTQSCTDSANEICEPCTICSGDQYYASPCTVTDNAVCANYTVVCGVDEFESSPRTSLSDRTCQKYTECGPDEAVIVEATPSSDRVCEHIDDCSSSPCQNGGTCIDGIQSYTCNCTFEYVGDNCEIFNSCLLDPCENGACEATAAGAVCHCDADFSCACCDVPVNGTCSFLNPTGSVCIPIDEAEDSFRQGNDDDDLGAAGGRTDASMIAGIVVGGLLAVMLVIFLLFGLARKAKDQPLNAVIVGDDMLPFARRERDEYRRCIAFNYLQTGVRPLMNVSNKEVFGLYQQLQLIRPPEVTLDALYKDCAGLLADEVSTDMYAVKPITKAEKEAFASQDATVDEAVEFLFRAMADHLMEMAIDFIHQQTEGLYNEPSIYEAFYSFIADFDPMQSSGGYTEIDDSTYELAGKYGDLYESANGNYGKDDVYALAEKENDSPYNLAGMNRDPIYSMSEGLGDDELVDEGDYDNRGEIEEENPYQMANFMKNRPVSGIYASANELDPDYQLAGKVHGEPDYELAGMHKPQESDYELAGNHSAKDEPDYELAGLRSPQEPDYELATKIGLNIHDDPDDDNDYSLASKDVEEDDYELADNLATQASDYDLARQLLDEPSEPDYELAGQLREPYHLAGAPTKDVYESATPILKRKGSEMEPIYDAGTFDFDDMDDDEEPDYELADKGGYLDVGLDDPPTDVFGRFGGSRRTQDAVINFEPLLLTEDNIDEYDRPQDSVDYDSANNLEIQYDLAQPSNSSGPDYDLAANSQTDADYDFATQDRKSKALSMALDHDDDEITTI